MLLRAKGRYFIDICKQNKVFFSCFATKKDKYKPFYSFLRYSYCNEEGYFLFIYHYNIDNYETITTKQK